MRKIRNTKNNIHRGYLFLLQKTADGITLRHLSLADGSPRPSALSKIGEVNVLYHLGGESAHGSDEPAEVKLHYRVVPNPATTKDTDQFANPPLAVFKVSGVPPEAFTRSSSAPNEIVQLMELQKSDTLAAFYACVVDDPSRNAIVYLVCKGYSAKRASCVIAYVYITFLNLRIPHLIAL